MNNLLSYEAEAILNLINLFDGVSLKQLELLHFEGTKTDILPVVNFLVNRQYINGSNKPLLLPLRSPRTDLGYTPEKSDCLWAFLDAIKREDGKVYKEDIEAAYKGTAPIQLCFIKDANISVNIVHINKSSITQLIYLQQRYYTVNNIQKGEEKEKRILHEFVSRDKTLLEKIDELELTMPYVKVLITGSDEDIPKIEYLD